MNDQFKRVKAEGLVLPKNWERAFGYNGTARFLAAYWEPAGDEAMFDDGRVGGTANWDVFLALVRSSINCLYIARALTAIGADMTWGPTIALGSSDNRATHWLVLDLQERSAEVMPATDAHKFLDSQHAPLPAFTPEQLQEAIKLAVNDLQVLFSGIDLGGFSFTARQSIRLCGCDHGWVGDIHNGYEPCPKGCQGGLFVVDAEVRDETPGL